MAKITTPNNQLTSPTEGNILVLLVGIDNYAEIQDLNGCLHDLDRIEGFLKKRFFNGGMAFGKKEDFLTTYAIPEKGYKHLKIYRLENEQATYTNIIDAFRSFLQPAGAADKVWFHFSGHGTEAPTAEAFKYLENNKDQCLLCYDCYADHESGVHGNMLADKEIAVLLSEIAGGNNGTPHIVVTIDCCHSGGLTRDSEEVTVRNIEMPEKAKQRALESYLNGHYSNMSRIIVPKSPHTVLTACNNLELAGEKNGGFFTNGLIDTLESVGGKISYADLLIHARQIVRQKRKKQTPQFEVIGGAKSYARFLEGTPDNSLDKYEVYFDGGWYIRCGSIQGLPANDDLAKIIKAGGTIEIEIHSTDQPNLVAAKATIKEVGPLFSPLILTEGTLHSGQGIYFGIFNYFPAKPAYVFLKLQEADQKVFIDAADNAGILSAQNIYSIKNPNKTTSHQLSISKEGHQYVITDLLTRQQRFFLDDNTDDLFDAIVKMVKYHRLLALNNKNTDLSDKVNLTIELMGNGDQIVTGSEKMGSLGKERLITANLTNSLQGEHSGNRKFNIYPKVSINNSSETLFVYLYSLWPDYAIEVEEEKKSKGFIDYSEFGSWGLDPGEVESTVYFKLIVSPEALDSYQLLQDGISETGHRGSRGTVIRSRPRFKDWCAITLKIKVIRGED